MIKNKSKRVGKAQVYENAGRRIFEMRLKKGYSREKMATQIGVSTKFLYEIEKGKKGFSSDILLLIGNFLGIGCDYIMTGEIVSPVYDEKSINIIEEFDSEQKSNLSKTLRRLHRM